MDRIPREVMHKVPTALLYSLEGMTNLDWKQLLKLQSQDGSFLFSPSSTAFALMQTKDENALEYLDKTVKRFNGGGKSVLSLIYQREMVLYLKFMDTLFYEPMDLLKIIK